jgi:DDE superfamily endonuclease
VHAVKNIVLIPPSFFVLFLFSKVLLLLDGHSSHVTYSVVQFCKEAGIVLFRLYPNSTHLLQPADASAMASLKQKWDKVLKRVRREHGPAARITKNTFPRYIREVFDQLEKKKDLLRKSFAVTGLYPFNSRAVDYSKLISEQSKRTGNFLNLTKII